jgi:hypothetical protein
MITMKDKLTITTKGISDFKDGELEEILDAIREAAPELEVTLEDPQRMEKGRYGVVWGEILQLFFSASFGYAFNHAVNAAVKKAREGWEQRQAHMARPRPRIVSIHGPDGRIIKSVRVDEDEGEHFDIGRLEAPAETTSNDAPEG